MRQSKVAKLFYLKVRDEHGNITWVSRVSNSLGFLKAVLLVEHGCTVLAATHTLPDESQIPLFD